MGYLYIDSGHWWRSEVLSCHALSLFNALASAHGQAHTHNHLGVLYTRQKQWRKAERHLLDAYELWNRTNDQHGLMSIHGNLGRLYNDMEQPLDAIAHLKLALDCASTTGDESTSGTLLINIAVGYMKQGNVELAYQYAHDAEHILSKFSDELQLAYVWHQRSLFHLRNDRLLDANHDKTRALTVYRRFRLLSDESRLLQDFEKTQAKLRANRNLRFTPFTA